MNEIKPGQIWVMNITEQEVHVVFWRRRGIWLVANHGDVQVGLDGIDVFSETGIHRFLNGNATLKE